MHQITVPLILLLAYACNNNVIASSPGHSQFLNVTVARWKTKNWVEPGNEAIQCIISVFQYSITVIELFVD